MTSTIKRTGKSKCTGMLVSKCKPNWATEVVLLRFIEENGASAVFKATGDAMTQLDQCELWRIYDVEVYGECVRKVDALKKYGVDINFEVVLKYSSKLDLSKAVWPLKFPYRLAGWLTLNQLDAGSVVDITGVVLKKPIMDLQSALPKLRVLLGNDGYQQEIEFLGEHARMSIKKGNVLALAGMRVQEYRGQRLLHTSFLTLIEVDPAPREGLPAVEKPDDGTPRRKAMRLCSRTTMSAADATSLGEGLLTAVRQARSTSEQEIAIVGYLGKITATFFDDDAPTVGDDAKEKICWRTTLADASDTLEVKVWDGAAFELFGLTASGLREKWEKGNEEPAEKDNILKELNAKLDSQFECACNLSVWSFGFKEVKHQVHINVNAVDVKE